MGTHRGVKFLEVAVAWGPDGEATEWRWVVRWRDAFSRKVVQRDCERLGLTNAKSRKRWATARAKALRIERGHAELGDAPLVTFKDSQKEYLERFDNKNTRSAKERPLAALAEFLAGKGAKNVQDIKAVHLHEWGEFVRRPSNPHGTLTRNLYLAVARAWLGWCRKGRALARVTPEELTANLERQEPPKDPIDVLQPNQIRELLTSCYAHDRAERFEIAPFALFVLLSGMRYREAEGLTWDEVDLNEKVVTLGSERNKNAAHRTITLSECPTAIDVLRALKLRGGRGRVFSKITRAIAEGARLRTVRDYAAPKDWTWHQLRRTCGSLAVCGGVQVPLVAAARLGHTLQVAQDFYLKAYRNLPRNCETIEQAGGFEAEAKSIVQAIAVVPAKVAQ